MEEFLNRIVLNNPTGNYLIVAAVIGVAFLFKKFVGRYSSRLIFFVLRKIGRPVDREAFGKLVFGPIENFLFLLIAFVALYSLTFPEAFQVRFMKTDSKSVVETIGLSVVILSFFLMLLRIIDYIALVMEKAANLTPELNDNQLVVFFKDFLKVILIIIGFLTMLRFAFNQDITTILAGMSIVGAAIALAARESIENLIASFIIFFDKPFSGGDMLKVNNITGTVERIGLRSTRIRTTEKTYVTVPNKQMVDSIVDNLTLRNQRRAEIRLEADLATTPAQLQNLLEGIGSILDNSPVTSKSVFLTEITPEAYIILAEYFTDAIAIQDFNLLRQEVNLEVISLLDSLGISIAGEGKEIKIVRK